MMLTILILTVAMFVWGRFSPDIVALLSLLALYLSGILTLEESLSGFKNNTVIMIGGLFIIGEALANTGWTALAGQMLIKRAKNNASRLLTLILMGSGVLSGFVSNTGTVATLMPVATSSAWQIGTLPSKMLIPLAFGSNTGGLLTLTGTPPNIIVNTALEKSGESTFSFFEFGLIGLPLLLIALLYFRYIGQHILPANKTNEPMNASAEMNRWIKSYQINQEYYNLRINSGSPLVNTTVAKFLERSPYKLKVERIHRVKKRTSRSIEKPTHTTLLTPNDVMIVKANANVAKHIAKVYNLTIVEINSLDDALKDKVISHQVGMTEILVSPQSLLVGRTMKLAEFFERFDISLLGVQRLGKAITKESFTIKQGDSFLVRGAWSSLEKLSEEYKDLVVCSSPDHLHKNVTTLSIHSAISLTALLLMIGLMVCKVVPNSIAVMVSAALVIVTGCLSKSKIYKSINWISLMMIAGMIPMGIALQKTGLAQSTADALVQSLGGFPPVIMLAGVFLLTSGLSQVINNSATALIMAPIVILAANSLGLSPKPFMVIVAVSASTAFLTPVGTTTNAMVMGAGGYKFADYIKVGLPLLLVFLVACLILVPMIWPF